MRLRVYLVLAALLLASEVLAIGLSWTALGRQFDQYAYDFLFRLEAPAPWQPASIILAIDEPTLTRYGGLLGMRQALASGLNHIAPAHPAAVAVDLLLTDTNPADSLLEAAFSKTKNLVLAADFNKTWEDPIPAFKKYAVAVGHVHADIDQNDGIGRALPLEKVNETNDRRWALALAAYLAANGGSVIESPDDLTIGNLTIPSARMTQTGVDAERHMRIHYAPMRIPAVSIAALDEDPSLASRFAGKVVFAGVTAQGAVRDRWMTPGGIDMAGIEMNANAFETISRRMFLIDPPLVKIKVIAVCLAFGTAAALIWIFLGGWAANIASFLLIAASQALPAVEFSHSVVWPWLPATLAAIFSVTAAAAWRNVLVRGELARAEEEKTRYQKTMQFVTHEMRTPLTAIQGSSELISRYGSMPEEKRKQMAELINSESKRLARMIEAFLSTERLSAGDVELKQERFPLVELVTDCVNRARPLAENKQIKIDIAALPQCDLQGDQELLEYAVYNLLTNAIKYSPPSSRVGIDATCENDNVRLAIQDEGIGMDKKEASRVFERFYRTQRAEQSGEMGTGIGLSIVQQIVRQHNGSISVESEPGRGSTFTLVLKRFA